MRRDAVRVARSLPRPRWALGGWMCVALVMLASVAAAGCTDVSRSTGDLVARAFKRHRTQMPTAAEVAASRYYQLYARSSDGQAVLILGNLDGAREDWYGKGGVVVFLRHGQLVKTTGLAQNLEGMHEAADNPFERGLQHLTAPFAYSFREDWSGYRYGVPINAQLVPLGATHIEILGVAHEVLRVRETLDAPVAHYHAVNQYWVDPHDGLVWKSIQQIVPGESLTLVQLKPYRGTPP